MRLITSTYTKVTAPNDHLNIRTAGALPKGFRFGPPDSVIVNYYMMNNITTDDIVKLDIYAFNHPDQVAEQCKQLKGKNEKNMYIFTPRHKLFPDGNKPNRSTGSEGNKGFWKATNIYADIKDGSNKIVGHKNTFEWYKGTEYNNPENKSDWIMHEYTLKESNEKPSKDPNNMMLDEVFCKLYKSKTSKKDKIQEVDKENQVPNRRQLDDQVATRPSIGFSDIEYQALNKLLDSLCQLYME